MNVYHVVNRNKLAKPKIIIENVVSIQFYYYNINYINCNMVLELKFNESTFNLCARNIVLHFDVCEVAQSADSN